MPTSVQIPPLGESITEAVVSSWLKPDGAMVKRDEEIAELETDKITMPIPAPASGVLHHNAAQGDTVTVGAVIATIDEPGAASVSAAEPKPAAAQKTTSDGKKASTTTPAAPAGAARTTPPPAAQPAEDVRATPLARKIAEERGVDLSRVHGSGPGGRIREQDVTAAASSAPAAEPQASSLKSQGSSPAVRREKMSPLRQRVAVRLVEAQHTAAILTTFNECDMSRVMDLRARYKESFEKSHGVKLGFMSFFVKACVSALRKVPSVNAFIVAGADGKSVEIEHHDYCDIAIAVGSDRGLVVPVLRNCESLSFADIEKTINDLAARAREGRITLEELQGGTFTISNGGIYGSLMGTPILNPPQSGVLGMYNIVRRPIENPDKPDSGEIVVRPMMYLALSYDHRLIDGEGAGTFLRHIKHCIEDPARLMFEV